MTKGQRGKIRLCAVFSRFDSESKMNPKWLVSFMDKYERVSHLGVPNIVHLVTHAEAQGLVHRFCIFSKEIKDPGAILKRPTSLCKKWSNTR